MSSELYTYQALDPQSNGVRLLQLLPSESCGLLRCTIRHVSLDNSPSYEAISYTWGIEEANHPIYIDSKLFRIRANLMSALQQFRSKQKARTLWVDAICINQADPEERSQQVQLMRRIYEQASQVLVWLGVGSGEERIMRYIGPFAYFYLLRSLIKAQFKGVWQPKYIVLAQLLSNPWFSRVWVVQEIAANKRALLCCGPFSMEWPKFIEGLEFVIEVLGLGAIGITRDPADMKAKDKATAENIFKTTASIISTASKALSMEEFRVSKSNGYYVRLEDTIEHMRGLSTTEPRDRIYAALGIAPLSDKSLIPNYTIKDEVVYIQTARSIIEESRSLNILRYCQPNSNPSLPSWVPDWSQPRTATLLSSSGIYQRDESYKASKESLASFKLESNSMNLFAQGVFVDTVNHVYSKCGEREINWQRAALNCIIGPFVEEPNNRIVPDNLSMYPEENLMRKGRYRTGGSVGDAFGTTLLAGRFAHLSFKAEDNPHITIPASEGFLAAEAVHMVHRGDISFKNVKINLLDLFSKIRKQIPLYKIAGLANVLVVYDHIAHTAAGKCFIVSQNKFMGLGTPYAQEGDAIVVLKGMEVPLIIRKAKDKDHYTVIGEACTCLEPALLNTGYRLTHNLFSRHSRNNGRWRGFCRSKCRYSHI